MRHLRFRPTAVSILTLALVSVFGVAPAVHGSADHLRDLVARADLTKLDGTPARIENAAEEVTVIHFWASWCPPCKKELPVLDGIAKSLEGRSVQFVAISIDSNRKKALRFVQRSGLSLPFYHDKPDGLAERLALPYLPCTYVIDRAGNTVFATTGAGEEQMEQLRAELFSLTARGQISRSSE